MAGQVLASAGEERAQDAMQKRRNVTKQSEWLSQLNKGENVR
jgi:hypothetical protein